MSFIPRGAIWLSCSAIVAAGCHSSEEPAPAAVAVAAAPAHAAAPAKPAVAVPHTPQLADPNVTSAHVAEFKPPFAERELFEPPKRSQGTVRRDEEQGQTVELKGFINVDGPRVVLSINGVISIIPEGGEKYGVHVNAIQPPVVVLQRGRNRWTATLE